MVANTAQPAAPRRRFAPRFSLAAALVAMALVALGLWYWFRVPFEVVHETKSAKEVESVRRTWGGTVRHGPRRVYVAGQLMLVENYRDGLAHGRWEWLDGAGKAHIVAEFRRGELQSFQASPECDQRLAKLLAEGAINDPKLVLTLFKPTKITFRGTPLLDAIQILKDVQQFEFNGTLGKPAGFVEGGFGPKMVRFIPISEEDRQRLLDDRKAERAILELVRQESGSTESLELVEQWYVPITCEVSDKPLVVALGSILQPHGLVCDYRYGLLWLSEPEEAERWKDPTGVSEIVPPPGSRLAAAWEDESHVEFIETPLLAACDFLSSYHGGIVKFDCSRLPQEYQQGTTRDSLVTANVKGIAFKNVLGLVLEQTRCQARLEGEKIVIEPQPGNPLADNP
ncbi:MAG TPA: hypothetical protein VFV87_09070 [Pirellulaceae bacterium]|nr:hypothetical protein [Pirellulaceae bacterium]